MRTILFLASHLEAAARFSEVLISAGYHVVLTLDPKAIETELKYSSIDMLLIEGESKGLVGTLRAIERELLEPLASIVFLEAQTSINGFRSAMKLV